VADEAELAPQRLVLAVGAAQHARSRELGGVALERGLERRGNVRPAARVRERAREPADAGAQQVERGLAMQRERARERLGADLRVAVHVRSRPRAERQLAPVDADVEAALELLEHLRDRVVKGGLEEEQVAPHLVGLPPQRQRLAQVGEERAPARAAGARVVEAVEQARHRELVLEHRAPRRLGRVSGQDQLDVERAHRGREVGAVGAELVGGVHQRLALAHAGGVVVTPAPHPLALLGDVGELELECAGADAGLDLGRREPVHELGHRRAGGGVSVRSSLADSFSHCRVRASSSPACSTSTSWRTWESSWESRASASGSMAIDTARVSHAGTGRLSGGCVRAVGGV